LVPVLGGVHEVLQDLLDNWGTTENKQRG
jgi:hypothetical protein